MTKKNPPCIRNLDRFKKSGCPQKSWDGEEGCPCWKELTTSTRTDPVAKIRKMCIDEWMFDLKITELGLLEGNQQAVETFRNGMLDISDPNNIRPKADLVLVRLVQFIQDQITKKQIIKEHEIENKLIEQDK